MPADLRRRVAVFDVVGDHPLHVAAGDAHQRPRDDGYRDWDTTMAAIQGDPQLTDAEVQQYSVLFKGGRIDAA